MNVDAVQIDSEHKTGIVDVTFENGEPAYDIVENSSWDFIDEQYLPGSENHAVLYHGSLALRNPVSEKSLHQLIQDNSGPVFVDVNLRPPWWDTEKIQSILTNAKWVKLNKDELALLVPEENELVAQARYLINHYQAELVVVTLGEEGALAVNENDTVSVKPRSETTVVDTVGAGDAFASILMLGLYKGWPLASILERAQQFASKIVGLRGATTGDKEFYQPFIKDWNI
jgi:fructokinase